MRLCLAKVPQAEQPLEAKSCNSPFVTFVQGCSAERGWSVALAEKTLESLFQQVYITEASGSAGGSGEDCQGAGLRWAQIG